MKHTIEVPGPVWEWAQRKYGKSRPATELRELLWVAMATDPVVEEPEEVPVVEVPRRPRKRVV